MISIYDVGVGRVSAAWRLGEFNWVGKLPTQFDTLRSPIAVERWFNEDRCLGPKVP